PALTGGPAVRLTALPIAWLYPRETHVIVRPLFAATLFAAALATNALAQMQEGGSRENDPMRSLKQPHQGGSTNIKVLSHIPRGPWSHVMDMEIEQELARPYAYVARADWDNNPERPRQTGGPVQYERTTSKGVDIIDLKDPSKARVIYAWRIPDGEL